MTLDEGWYLMSVKELERELARLRDPSQPPTDAPHLTIEEALEARAAGNVPDENGRSLRLVLHVSNVEDVRSLSRRRLEFEPDFHDEPTWRRDGSVPINVVPMRLGPIEPAPDRDWWNEPDIAELEAEWRRTGKVDDVRIPDGYRGFVFKTVLSLRAAGRPITVETILASVARWLTPEDVATLRDALHEANP